MEFIDLSIYRDAGFATTFTIKDSDGIAVDITGYTFTMSFYDSYGTLIVAYTESDTQLLQTGITGEIQLNLNPAEVVALSDGFYNFSLQDGTVDLIIFTGIVSLINVVKSNIEYLLPFVRLKLGDINPSAYRYADEWLIKSMTLAIKSLQRYWNFKYLIDENNIVSRNANSDLFVMASPPIIESADEYVIVLMSTIITLEGSLENSAWDTSSWSDAEIRYTNIDAGRIRDANLKRLIDELNSIILPPTKKLARARKLSLPGYIGNQYEQKTEY